MFFLKKLFNKKKIFLSDYQEKIDNAQIDEYPFPHLVIDNILNQDLLLQIKKYWPNKHLHNDLRGSSCFYFSSELNKQNLMK